MSEVNVKLALRAMPSVESDGFECYWLQDEAGRNIGSINGPQCPETEALANKIAVAPEMYEALVKLSNEVMGSLPMMEALARREFGNTNYNILIQRAEEARAIIAKAEAR